MKTPHRFGSLRRAGSLVTISWVLLWRVDAAEVETFSALAAEGRWTEVWLDEKGGEQAVDVMAKVWNAAIQAALAHDGSVHLPNRGQPYYLDGPIILKSGQKLAADRAAEVRLKPGTNTCMVCNEHVVGFADGPVPEGLTPDSDILIEGGVWTTLANGAKSANGNRFGRSDKQHAVAGTHGVMLLQNARKITVRQLTVRQSRPFAVHLGNVREFLVEGIRLDRHGRDGVHVNGPASDGVIRDVSGDSHDDTVSIAAWDWRNCAPSFGPIHHLVIERVAGVPAKLKSTDAIRLLPGVKRFDDGTTLDCPISDIVLRDLTDIREFKFYDQPNLELGRDKDASVGLGKLRRIQMERLVFTRPGVIQVAAEVDGLAIRDVRLAFPPAADFKLVEMGPMSATYQHQPGDPATWVEIFSPDHDVTVRGFSLQDVFIDQQAQPEAATQLVRVRPQTLNPDYPRTTPRGGTGKVIFSLQP